MVHLHGWAGVMTVKCMVTQRRSADTAEEGWDCVKKTRSLTWLRYHDNTLIDSHNEVRLISLSGCRQVTGPIVEEKN